MELSAQTDAGKARARACRELNACGIAALPFPGGSGVGKGWGQLGDGAPAAPQLCPAGLGGREGGVLFPNRIFQACHLFPRVWI